MALLAIEDLQLDFGRGPGSVRALDGVSLLLAAGQTLCLVGESGSGKSVTALSIGRLLPSPPAHYVGGRILLEGRDALRLDEPELRAIRGRVLSYVFQEPGASLNPVLRVGDQIREALRLHRPGEATADAATRLLHEVGIPAPAQRLRAHPHELSGGMQQRVMIAMALASRPKLLVADEPTTALDVTIQAQILDLLRGLQERLGMAMLFITHNLALVAGFADRVAVMYAGQIVEEGPAAEVLARPLHPYTRALIDSAPRPGAGLSRLRAIPGNVPQLGAFPPGCRFHPRCPQAVAACGREVPQMREVQPGRTVRCPFATFPLSPA